MSNQVITNASFKADTSTRDVPTQVLIEKNQLEYKEPEALSVMKQRKLNRHHATLTSYTPEKTIQIQHNVSDDLILGPNSILYFSIYADQACHFGKGSALNLFEEVNGIHRTGNTITTEQKKNVYMRNKMAWITTAEWRERNGDMFYLEKRDTTTARTEVKNFYDEADVAGTAAAQLTAYDHADLPKTTKQALDVFAVAGAAASVAGADSTAVYDAVQAYVLNHKFDYESNGNYQSISTDAANPTKLGIPMSLVCGFFAPNRMIPHFLTSGLKLNIKLASAANALIATVAGTPQTTFTISDVYMAADSFIPNDEILEELTEMSTGGNLTYSFPTYGLTPKSLTGTSLHITSEQAIAFADIAWLVSRQTSAVDDAKYDSLAGEGAAAISNYQYRLGSQYYPPNRLENPVEMYHWSLNSWGQLNGASVSYDDFFGVDLTNSAGWSDWTQARGEGLMVCSLERSTVLDLSGLPVSGLQAVVLDATYGTARDRTCDMFIDHVAIVRPFLFSRLIVKA